MTSAESPAVAYIQTEAFDVGLLTLPLVSALAVVAAATINPLLFPVLIVADLWLLGYHHVVATYTRLASDRATFLRHRFLALDLLIIVTAVAVGLSVWFGIWLITTAFLYLQWFHYMRQGYGIARMYYRTTGAFQAGRTRDLTADSVIYSVPIYGILQRSATMGNQFLGSPARPIVVPGVVIAIAAAAAAAAVLIWLARTASEWARGELEPRYAGFIASHVAIFLVAYVVVDSGDVGWLGINVWHNFQYVMVVWMVNTRRYSHGIDPKARFMSKISQPNHVLAYFVTCVAISTFVYFNLSVWTTALIGSGVAAALGVYMGINFHHYVVDAVIWKRRRVAAQLA